MSKKLWINTCTLMVILFLVWGASVAAAQVVTLTTRGAEVWSQSQQVTGTVSGSGASRGVLYVNGVGTPFDINHSRFSVRVQLIAPKSVVFARIDHKGHQLESARVVLKLGFVPRPEVLAYATIRGRTVTLRRSILSHPDATPLAFSWSQDADNPLKLPLAQLRKSRLTLPYDAPQGEYYFTLHINGSGRSWRSRTYVTVTKHGLQAFNIDQDHATWIDKAVIYGVTPYAFVPNGELSDVTAKIPELAALGVTTLWLQPIFRTYEGGQGYDIIDYFSLRSDYGTAADLHKLVRTAHAHGLRVILDFVPNHSSIQHPYAQDAIRYGRQSHYFSFYQRHRDNVRYAAHYNNRKEGKMNFIYYFWQDLPNLNYHSLEVQRWMIEAGRYWLEQYDIDGYRIDAAWGVNARNPEFMQRWRLALKRLKPDVLLLGEDKASRPSAFDRNFDAAYDWAEGEDWVSQWSWQTDYTPDFTRNPTVFNYSDEKDRAQLLATALVEENNKRGLTLRFLENNDTPRFLPTHEPSGLARTRMAAALTFTLPGIPLIFNGQEVGYPLHPYETPNIFWKDQTIESQDQHGLFLYYRKLITLRERFPALRGNNFQLLPVDSKGSVLAFHRWQGVQHLVVVVNLGSNMSEVEIGLNSFLHNRLTRRTVTDLMNGATTKSQIEEGQLRVDMDGYSTRILMIGRTN